MKNHIENWSQVAVEPWRPKENHIESWSRVAVELNIFNPKVLYFTILDRESSVQVRQTRFHCQIPSFGAWSKDCLVAIAMAVTWPSYHCCSVKTCLLKTDGPSRLTCNSRAAMHDLSQDCRSEFSRVPQSDPGPLFGLGSASWILLFPKVEASCLASWGLHYLTKADSAGTWQRRGLHWWALELAPAGCSATYTPKLIAGCSVDTWSSSRFLIFFL